MTLSSKNLLKVIINITAGVLLIISSMAITTSVYQKKIDKINAYCSRNHQEIEFVEPANITPKGE